MFGYGGLDDGPKRAAVGRDFVRFDASAVGHVDAWMKDDYPNA